MISKTFQFFFACTLGLSLCCVHTVNAQSKSVVYATIPELAWIAGRLTEQSPPVDSLLEPGVNAHYVDAKPSFIMKLRKADMVCSVGLGLEGAWLDRAIERSFNTKLQTTHACVLGGSISVIGRAEEAKDRSFGHLHAEGNPHFWYAPSRMIEATEYIAKRLTFLAEEDSSRVDQIQKNSKELVRELRESLVKAQQKLASKSIRTVSQYHSDFDYVISDLGLEKVMSIESKPGVPPSTEQLSKFKKTIQEKKVKVILSLPWDPKGVVSKLADSENVKVVEWPVKEADYLKAFDVFVSRLDGALK